ncbi:MAG: N-acetylmuramoyl-L-alanine amidase [Legionella sp.]|uniref:N-acetylmuramoyl-L-alanine amidase family protein n=1 Tax=Legionella sp. TaxID=459 RepID=UPI0039E63370
MIRRLWFLFAMLWLCSLGAFAAHLVAVDVKQQKNRTSVFLTLDGPFTHKLFSLSQPERVVVDLNETRLAVNLNQSYLHNALIQRIRTGSANVHMLRLVFDVSQQVQIRSTPWLPPSGSYGVRVDLMYQHEPMAVASSARTQKTAAIKPIGAVTMVKPSPILHQKALMKVGNNPAKRLRDVIVVLDAGHGGKDCGAKGPHDSQEKNVVLAITLKLKRLIDQQPGMHAVLTRSGDYYVGLRERLDIARKYNGDIFVAIHADAFHNPNSHGASVFALSQGGATSEAARWLAEKENYSELGGVNLGELDDQNGVVRSVLIDLSQTATINAGLQMGVRVLGQLGSFASLHNTRVEQARFVVLKSPDIPSILVETGFISNPHEERNLTNPAYQMRLSQAIFQGIKGYFWENPPHGSRIEAMVVNKIHLVRAGETLPMIAARYRVTVNALQETNYLQGITRLKVGQKLVIPTA